MEEVTIHWAKGVIEFSDIESSGEMQLDYVGFYAILGARRDAAGSSYTNVELLYIGQAYEQILRKRIVQPHSAYACVTQWLKEHPGFVPVIMIGLREVTSQRSQSLYDDIECCLIFDNQPRCNDKCKEGYSKTGRHIRITNEGDYAPLRQVTTCGCAPSSKRR